MIGHAVAHPMRDLHGFGALPALLCVGSGVAVLAAAANAQDSLMTVTGILTDEGVECQALRADSGELFTLLGDLKGFRLGQRVRVSGQRLEASSCQQGTTLRIGKIAAG